MATEEGKKIIVEYPEHEKMKVVQDDSQVIGDFIEWLYSRDFSICELDGNSFYRTHYSIERLLASYFNIDLKKIEQEKLTMLNSLKAK